MFYEYQRRRLAPHLKDTPIDLRFATMLRELALPERAAHNALNDAVMAALAFVKLRHLLGLVTG